MNVSLSQASKQLAIATPRPMENDVNQAMQNSINKASLFGSEAARQRSMNIRAPSAFVQK